MSFLRGRPRQGLGSQSHHPGMALGIEASSGGNGGPEVRHEHVHGSRLHLGSKVDVEQMCCSTFHLHARVESRRPRRPQSVGRLGRSVLA